MLASRLSQLVDWLSLVATWIVCYTRQTRECTDSFRSCEPLVLVDSTVVSLHVIRRCLEMMCPESMIVLHFAPSPPAHTGET